MLFKALWRPRYLPTKTLRIMRITSFFLLAAVLQVSARGLSQTVSYSGRNVPLATIFSAVEKQTGYVFFYDDSVMERTKPVSVTASGMALQEFLTEVLKEQPVKYSMEGKTIFISRKEVILKPKTPADLNGDVHGRVTDSAGAPLVGASVLVKGTKKGTISGKDGQFELKDVAPDATLIISFTGYETSEVHLGGRVSVTVAIKQLSTSMLEFVISKGYYSTTEKLNTGDVTVVKGEDIQKQPVTDPMLALEGRVPGLYIQQTSGIPGAYSTIRVMGQNSLANGNDPLYLIDGIPFSSKSMTTDLLSGGAVGNPTTSQPNGTGLGLSPFNTLNPDDIESITVLKDADATAIYGSRGANGVIIITTRRGKAGNTRFDVNVYTGVSQVTREMHLLNTQQYLEMRHEALRNDGLSPRSSDYDINGVWDTTRYTDWQKVLFGNPARFTNGQVNVSGGNSNTQFLAGGGYSVQDAVYPGSFSDKKANGHLNITHASANQRFHLQLGANYTSENSNLPNTDFSKSLILAPDAPALFDANGNLNWQMYSGAATWGNPLAYLYLQSNSIATTLLSNLNVNYEILRGLQIKGTAGYTEEYLNQTYLSPATKADQPPYNIPANSGISLATTIFKRWLIEPQISYQKKILGGALDAMIGSTFQQDLRTSQKYDAEGFTSDALINNPLNASYTDIGGNEYTLYHYAALYGRIGYNWKEKYIVNLTGRRDGSSRFGPGKQFGNFGAAGLGWIFTNEGLLKDVLPLSFGKLRASYGITGNDQITDYQYLSTYSSLSSTYLGDAGLIPTRIANPYYGWEVVKKLQIGIDLGFLKERVIISGSYYRNRDGSQLVGYPLPRVAGFTSITANLPALVQNSGGEFTVNTINIKRKDFSWTTSLNLTVPRNKLISYPGIQNSSYLYTYNVGYSLNSPSRYVYAGVNSQTGVYTFYSATYKSDTIHPKYPLDLVPTKPVTQSYYGGLSNSFSYKGVQLDVFFQFVKQLGYSYANYFANPGTALRNEPVAVLARWQKPGDNARVGRFSTNSGSNPYSDLGFSNGIITDASFIRLKNVAISYQLPASWRNKAKLQNARIYFQAQNLFTVTKYAGLDPETGGIGLPPMRMITGGIQVTL